jgi:predicted amidophosphoribosyltransferase
MRPKSLSRDPSLNVPALYARSVDPATDDLYGRRMLTPRCGHCMKPLILEAKALCSPCKTLLADQAYRAHPRAALTSLYRYHGLVRGFVIRAKVRSDHSTLDLIRDLMCARPEALEAASWADAIMPCPSSLWSRMRGRLDLGHHLAAGLAEATGRPLITAPPHLFWRVRKRAQHKAPHPSQKGPQIASLAALLLTRWIKVLSANLPSRILLVDDVVTTGFTLCEVMATLPPGCTVRALTFAAGADAREAFHRALSSFLDPQPFGKPRQALSLSDPPHAGPKVLP